MILTNELLSLSLTIISNFVAAVGLPSDAAPSGPEQVLKFSQLYGIGVDSAFVVMTNGSYFSLTYGAVDEYGAQFGQDRAPGRSGRMGPASAVSSNGAVQMTRGILARLGRSAPPLTLTNPEVSVITSAASEASVCRVLWHAPEDLVHGGTEAAIIEIEARGQQVSYLKLWRTNFFDYDLAREIRARVCRSEPPPKPRPYPPEMRPGTNQVLAALGGCAEFARRLGCDAGLGTNLATVDWERTHLYRDPRRSESRRVCQVWFRDGGCFEAMDGFAFGWVARDACFTGTWDEAPPSYFNRFEGPGARSWEAAADAFKTDLVKRVGLPASLVEPLVPHAVAGGAIKGGKSLTRVLVHWNGARTPRDVGFDEALILSEFDLTTGGGLKLVAFLDPALTAALREALAKPGPM